VQDTITPSESSNTKILWDTLNTSEPSNTKILQDMWNPYESIKTKILQDTLYLSESLNTKILQDTLYLSESLNTKILQIQLKYINVRYRSHKNIWDTNYYKNEKKNLRKNDWPYMSEKKRLPDLLQNLNHWLMCYKTTSLKNIYHSKFTGSTN